MYESVAATRELGVFALLRGFSALDLAEGNVRMRGPSTPVKQTKLEISLIVREPQEARSIKFKFDIAEKLRCILAEESVILRRDRPPVPHGIILHDPGDKGGGVSIRPEPSEVFPRLVHSDVLFHAAHRIWRPRDRLIGPPPFVADEVP